MSDVTVVNHLPKFSNLLDSVLDDAIKEGAVDGLVNARTKAPFDMGGLRADSETKQIKRMHWRISFWKIYARYQEFGGDSKRTVRKYTTSGTGAHFLRNAGDEQFKKLVSKFKKHGSRVKV